MPHDFDLPPATANQCPTLVCMDSGVGGLAVLKQFVDILPESAYWFIGDTQWMPYGEKPLDDICGRVLQIHHIIEAQCRPAAFVLACNTATVATYAALKRLNLPYPVLEPVQTTAHFVNETVAGHAKIGVIATPATVESNRYGTILSECFDIRQVGCTGLASIVESGHARGAEMESVLHPYLAPLKAWGAQVILSGCTHYYFLRDAIKAYFPWPITLIDSAEVMAQQAAPLLAHLSLASGPQRISVTGNPQQFGTAMAQLGLDGFHNQPIDAFNWQVKQPL